MGLPIRALLLCVALSTAASSVSTAQVFSGLRDLQAERVIEVEQGNAELKRMFEEISARLKGLENRDKPESNEDSVEKDSQSSEIGDFAPGIVPGQPIGAVTRATKEALGIAGIGLDDVGDLTNFGLLGDAAFGGVEKIDRSLLTMQGEVKARASETSISPEEIVDNLQFEENADLGATLYLSWMYQIGDEENFLLGLNATGNFEIHSLEATDSSTSKHNGWRVNIGTTIVIKEAEFTSVSIERSIGEIGNLPKVAALLGVPDSTLSEGIGDWRVTVGVPIRVDNVEVRGFLRVLVPDKGWYEGATSQPELSVGIAGVGVFGGASTKKEKSDDDSR